MKILFIILLMCAGCVPNEPTNEFYYMKLEDIKKVELGYNLYFRYGYIKKQAFIKDTTGWGFKIDQYYIVPDE